MQYYNDEQLDAFLDNGVFPPDQHGFFVDIGCYDGLLDSVTLFFEQQRGWRGVCIDAAGPVFEELQGNRKADCHNVCIAGNDEPALFYENDRYSGLLTLYNWDIAPASAGRPGADCVQNRACTPFSKFWLERYGSVNNIDLLCVDVMGSEVKVLESIDFEAIKVKVLVVSNRWGFGSDYIFSFLKRHSFVLIHQTPNREVYVSGLLLG